MKPSICNSGWPISLPEICGDDFIFLPINKLTDVNPDRNHAYVLPNDDVYIVNHAGSRVIKLSSSSDTPIFDEVTDGLEIVTVNKVQLLRVRVGDGILINDDNQIILDPKMKYVLPVATDETLGGVKLGEYLSSDEDGKVSVDLSLEDLGGQTKLTTGSGIVIDTTDPENPTISTESNTHVLPNGTNGIAIADGKVALAAKNLFTMSIPEETNPKVVMIIRRDGGSLALAYLQPYLTAGEGINIDETNPKAPIISLDGDYATKQDLKNHVENKENPHEVTAHQVGALTAEEKESGLVVMKNTKVSNQDWNAITETGIYSVGQGTGPNSPTGTTATWGYLVVYRRATDWIEQAYYSSGAMYRRVMQGTPMTWSAWGKMASQSDLKWSNISDKPFETVSSNWFVVENGRLNAKKDDSKIDNIVINSNNPRLSGSFSTQMQNGSLKVGTIYLKLADQGSGDVFEEIYDLNLGQGYLKVTQKNGIVQLTLVITDAVYQPNSKIYENGDIDSLMNQLFNTPRLERINVYDFQNKTAPNVDSYLIEFSNYGIVFVADTEVAFRDNQMAMVTFTMIPNNEL